MLVQFGVGDQGPRHAKLMLPFISGPRNDDDIVRPFPHGTSPEGSPSKPDTICPMLFGLLATPPKISSRQHVVLALPRLGLDRGEWDATPSKCGCLCPPPPRPMAGALRRPPRCEGDQLDSLPGRQLNGRLMDDRE